MVVLMSSRTATPAPSPSRHADEVGQSPWLIGLLESAQAVAIVAVLALACGATQFFLFDGEGAAAGAIVTAAASAWSVSFALPVPFLGGVFSLPPLLVSLVPAALLWRSGRRAAEALTVARIRGEAPRHVTAAAVAGLLALPILVSLGALALADGFGLLGFAEGGRSLGMILVAVAAGLVSYRGGEESPRERSLRWLDERTQGWGVAVARLALRGVAALLALGLLALVVSLALNVPVVAEISQAYSSGVAGQVGLIVVQLAFLPVAALWSLAWISGAGFGVGVGTLYAPTAVEPGPLPAIPALAALPAQPLPALLLAAVAVVAVGWWLGRGLLALEPEVTSRHVFPAVALDAAVGLSVWWLAALSSGGLGPDRLLSSGPSWFFALLVAGEVGLGVAVCLVVRRWGETTRDGISRWMRRVLRRE